MKTDKKPAQDIPVADFRMILQWPLLLDLGADAGAAEIQATVAKYSELVSGRKENGWRRVENAAHYPAFLREAEKGDPDALAYAQTVYFHDFVQEFLFEGQGVRPEVTVHERTDVTDLHMCAAKNETEHRFSVDRVSLHLFSIGVAIFSFELRWVSTANKAEKPLFLADCQTIIDLLRRSFVPYLAEKPEDEKRGGEKLEGGGVPDSVELTDENADGRDCRVASANPKDAETVLKAVREQAPTQSWAQCFDHWARLTKPFELISAGGCWRDPADERIPVNSLIRLAVEPEPAASGQDSGPQPDLTAEARAVLAVRSSDWYRLAEADSADSDLPYNARFMAEKARTYFYDRFFPSAGCNKCATRHIFGASHYCVVSAGWFAEDHLVNHFRRHYALMGLIVRLEQAVLLSLSRRLSRATAELTAGSHGRAEAAFEDRVIGIHGDFLKYCHRYRFTGVSNQIQPTEMLAMWRKSMGLDALFADVEGELAAAFQRVSAMQQKRESEASVDLSRLAAAAALLGLVAAFVPNDIRQVLPWSTSLSRLIGGAGLVLVMLPLVSIAFGLRSRTFRIRLMWGAMFGVVLMIAAWLGLGGHS